MQVDTKSLHTAHGDAQPERMVSRRAALRMGAVLAAASCLLPLPMPAAAEEPGSLETAQRMAAAIEKDFVEKQYYVTGNLTRELFEDDCTFIDPTTNVKGVEPYTRAVAMLFDSDVSRADLISIEVEDATHIRLRWRLEGAIKGLRIKPYTGTTVYTLSPDTGRVKLHYETWDSSAVDVFVSCFFPSFGVPPAPPVEVLRAAEAGKA